MELLLVSALMVMLIIFCVIRGRNAGWQDFPVKCQDVQEGQAQGFRGKHLRRSIDSVEYWNPAVMHPEGSPEYLDAVHRFEVGLGAEFDDDGRMLVLHPASDRDNKFTSPHYNNLTGEYEPDSDGVYYGLGDSRDE